MILSDDDRESPKEMKMNYKYDENRIQRGGSPTPALAISDGCWWKQPGRISPGRTKSVSCSADKKNLAIREAKDIAW